MRFALLLWLVSATTVQAQTSLQISVTDATTGSPVRAAVATATRTDGTPVRIESDSTGSVTLANLRGGNQTITVQAIGYESASYDIAVREGFSTDLRVSLKPSPIGIQRIEATAKPEAPRTEDLKLNGFYERMKLNRGIFVDQAEIDNRKKELVSDLIRSKQGVSLRQVSGAEQVLWFRGNEMPSFAPDGGARLCGPTIYLDGLPVHQSNGEDPSPIDRYVNASDLAGIEIYRRATQIPEQYGGANSGCGVVLLWTRVRS